MLRRQNYNIDLDSPHKNEVNSLISDRTRYFTSRRKTWLAGKIFKRLNGLKNELNFKKIIQNVIEKNWVILGENLRGGLEKYSNLKN